MTYQSEYGKIVSLLVKHPKDAFHTQDNVDKQWRNLFYTSKPDVLKAQDDYEAFLEIFTSNGIEVNILKANEETGLDSIYVRDASITTNSGIILCSMGKGAREGEPKQHKTFYEQNEIPIIGSVNGPGTVEGGDVAWIDESTFAIAWGYRTNKEGIDQMRGLMKGNVEEFIVVPSPHFRGPTDVFHLMSVFSPVDKNLAVVYSPLMSVPFRQELIRRGIELVEVPESEFDSLGCNVLAIAPRVCVMTEGNPITRSRLEAAGAEVITYKGEEISLKGNGGPTCLTRPLKRAI